MIDPCIPSSWDGFEVDRIFRGKKLHITVKNPDHIQKGKPVYIPLAELDRLDSGKIDVTMKK